MPPTRLRHSLKILMAAPESRRLSAVCCGKAARAVPPWSACLLRWDIYSLFVLNADSMSALLLRDFVLRLRHSHQPLIEPADDVLEAFDAMPGLA